MGDQPDNVFVGKFLGHNRYTVDDEAIARYIAGTRDNHPWYHGDSPLDGAVAPALLLHSEQYRFPLNEWYLPQRYGNLHIKQEWDLFRAVPLGSRLKTHGMIIDRYIRKDRDVVVLEFSIFDERDDVMVARGRCHQSFLLAPDVQATVVGKDDATRKRRAEDTREPLEVLGPVEREVDLALCREFSGPGKNYHNDADEAGKLGFPDVVVQGTLNTTFISEMLTNRFGMGWLQGGRMSLNLINVLWGGETSIARGIVREITPEGDHRRAHLDVRAEKPDGTRTVAGSASALIVA